MHTVLHSKDTPPQDDNICPVTHMNDNGDDDDDLAGDDKEKHHQIREGFQKKMSLLVVFYY